ncbi:MAG: right-handed parallel beta-helix repeat-containing protein [Calditrichia bacterium]
MKLLKPLLLITLLICSAGKTASLQQVYDEAGAGLGYDKLLLLHPDSLYTGGLAISTEQVGIKGYGALIDLNNGSIEVLGNSRLEIDACIIINGSIGLNIPAEASVLVTHCTFYGNQTGIQFMSVTGAIEVYNTILAQNTQYGFACDEASIRSLHHIDAFQNGMDYAEWCST